MAGFVETVLYIVLFEIGIFLLTIGLTVSRMSPIEQTRCIRDDRELDRYCQKYALSSWIFAHLIALGMWMGVMMYYN